MFSVMVSVHRVEGCCENSEFTVGPVAQWALAKGVFIHLLWDKHRNELDTMEKDRDCGERPLGKFFLRCWKDPSHCGPALEAPDLSRDPRS